MCCKKSPKITEKQYVSILERCPECQSVLKISTDRVEHCPKCGWRKVPYYDRGPRGSATEDHWNGATDNREKLLEDDYSKGRR